MMISIPGRVPSKKNSRRQFLNRKTGKRFSVPSAAFERYKTDALASILPKRRKILLDRPDPPYSVRYVFRMTGKAATDVDNMVASINDILQDAELIEDDREIEHIEAWKIFGCDRYETLVSIDRLPEPE